MKTSRIYIVFAFFFAFVYVFNFKTYANSNLNDYAKLELIKGSYIDDNVILGIKFTLKEGWKIYDNRIQELGLPTKIKVSGSDDILNYQIYYPAAEKFIEFAEYTSFGYKDEVIFPLSIKTKANIELQADIMVEFALCNNICLKFNENINFNLKQKQVFPDNLKLINELGHERKIVNYLYIILSAFLAGIILNFMPCVLPIIFLKIYHLLEKRNQAKKEVIFISTFTILGIIFAFLSFAIGAILLQKLGVSLGWGMHFQEPLFIASLALIITLFCCNIFDFFTINLPGFLVRKLDKVSKSEIKFVKHFATGVLAAILATPCSAPFLGTALAFALSGTSLDILLIFFALALGMSTPYILLIIKPNILKLLPKAGRWMLKLKKIMGLFLVLTIMWLVYVLYAQTNIFVIMIFLGQLFFMVFLLKKRAAMLNLTNLIIYRLLILATLVMAILTIVFAQSGKEREEKFWRNFNNIKLDELIEQKQIIFVNVTADWCLTCKFNDLSVLNRQNFRTYIKENNIIAVKADYTNSDKNIELLLNSVGRYAVPTYIIYSLNHQNGEVQNEILNIDNLINRLDYEIEQSNILPSN